MGSAEFAAALADADFFPGFPRAVADWQQRFTSHPRPGPSFRLRASAEELANCAVRMFREQYKPAGIAAVVAERATETPADAKTLLRQKRALSEIKLAHPKIPFRGVLDRVQLTSNGVELVDFKTGKPSETHRRQLMRYALLWWRATGEAPVLVTAQYLDGSASWPVTQAALDDLEADLMKKIARLVDTLRIHPAEARSGTGCSTCAVRARCDTGWAVGTESPLVDGRGDAELVVAAQGGDYGFIACSRTGTEIAIVFEPAVAKLLPERVVGQVLRVLDGVWKAKRTQLELKAWTEIFLVKQAP